MRIGGILVLLAVSVPTSAMADWAYTHWGMTPEQVAAASDGKVAVLPPAQRTRIDVDHSELSAEGTYTDGAVRLHVGFTFDVDRGGLKCVMYNAMGSDAGALQEVLRKRYGKPSHEGSFGESEMATWHSPDTIELATGKRPAAAAVSHCAPD